MVRTAFLFSNIPFYVKIEASYRKEDKCYEK